MARPLYQVDSFTGEPFEGNPAGVCLLDAPAEAAWMQRVAAEMNLSETAFITPPHGDGLRRIRYFTPTVEVELCGHATLASAHVLWERGDVPDREAVRLTTIADETLTCTRGDGGWIAMDFPLDEPVEVDPPAGLVEALSVTPRAVCRGRYDWLVEVEDEGAVRGLWPKPDDLRPFDRGVLVTARADAHEFDFVSRCFFPAAGIDEDPVTGSAHGALGAYWSRRLDKAQMTAYQASRRGGTVRLTVDRSRGRATIAGRAVTVFAAELRV